MNAFSVGFRTLFYKEILRFWKVATQTIAAPVVSAMLYLLIFGHVLDGRVEMLLQALLEPEPVGDEQVGVPQRGGLLRRDLERVRVGVRLHEGDDASLIADELADHIAQDVRRDDDHRPRTGPGGGRRFARKARKRLTSS